MKKLITRSRLAADIRKLQKSGKCVVFTNGCFDLLHIGHVRLFKAAKKLGDVLVIGLNSDTSLRRLKGPARPLVNQRSRAEVLSALEPVDYVVIFNEDTPAELLSALKPDILVKGGDYRLNDIVGRDQVKKVVRFPLVAGNSTSGLIKKIIHAYGTKS